MVANIRAQVAAKLGEEEPDWVVQHEIETKVRELEVQEMELEQRLEGIRRREEEERRRAAAAGRDVGLSGRKRLVSDAFAPVGNTL